MTMDAVVDPEGREIEQFRKVVPQKGYRLLNVGCGNGRLSAEYARNSDMFVGVDPDPARLAEACRSHRQRRNPKLHFVQAVGEALPLPGGFFDVVVLPWSL